ELVLVKASCNMRMPARVDIRIHANSDARGSAALPHLSRSFVDENVEFRLGFHVEQQDPLAPRRSISQGLANLVAILADTGEDDAITAHTDALQVMQLPARNNVKAATQLRQPVQN